MPPLPEDVPVDDIARWLARLIEQDGHLAHDTAAHLASQRGYACTYIYFERDEWRYRRDKRFSYEYRFHPDILWALKKLTGKSVIWEKDCRGWHKRKSPVSGLVSVDH